MMHPNDPRVRQGPKIARLPLAQPSNDLLPLTIGGFGTIAVTIAGIYGVTVYRANGMDSNGVPTYYADHLAYGVWLHEYNTCVAASQTNCHMLPSSIGYYSGYYSGQLIGQHAGKQLFSIIADPQLPRPVALTSDGGSGGNNSGDGAGPSWTYTVKSPDSVTIATKVPLAYRQPLGSGFYPSDSEVLQAVTGTATFGGGTGTGTGPMNVVLWTANEIINSLA